MRRRTEYSPAVWAIAHLVCIALVITAVVLRAEVLPRVTPDMQKHLLRWYENIRTGGLAGPGSRFSDYSPLYLYLIVVATTAHGWLEPVQAIKTISMMFDVGAAAVAYLIMRLHIAEIGARIGALSLLILPTVWLNSASWGQCDVIYTTFILGSVYFLLRRSPVWSMMAFGVAFSFKLQAVFLFPFMAFEWWRRRYDMRWFLLVPLIYIVAGIPFVLFGGGSFVDLLLVYARQARSYTDLSISAASVWAVCFLTPDRCRSGAGVLGVAATATAVLLAAATAMIFRRYSPRDGFLFTMVAATTSALLVPLVLPRMHERYFFPADVLSFVLAVCVPRLWYVAAVIQSASVLAYGTYLWGYGFAVLLYSAALNIAALVALLVEVVRAGERPSAA